MQKDRDGEEEEEGDEEDEGEGGRMMGRVGMMGGGDVEEVSQPFALPSRRETC